ncbi:MAG: GspE/PulE family protein [Anaerolineales bacterium]
MTEATREQEPTQQSAGRPKLSIGQVLINADLITPSQLQQALDMQAEGDPRRLGNILIEEGWLEPESLAMALSVHLNIPFIDLKRHRIQAEALQRIPESTARRYSLVPLDQVDGTLAVVMEDPTDIQVIEELEAISGQSITPMVGVSQDIKAAIDLSYKANKAIEQEVATFAPGGDTGILTGEEADLAQAEAQDPVVRAVDMILDQAVKERASDIHIVPDHNRIRVRYRVDGILRDALSLPRGSHSPLISRIKILANMNIAERRRPQDGQFSKRIGGDKTFFRVATSDTTDGEMVTLRVLGRSEAVFDLPELGLSKTDAARLRRIIHSPFGMVLVSGPTGSGKTTTLYAALKELDSENQNILTIEDPVEYNFGRIQQIQVNRAAEITFASGLRGIMRMDPDIVLVGEIRDRETAQAATQASLTGHLVLSSIHANEASGAFYRLDHLGVERYLLVSASIGVVAQRLVRKICPHCREQKRVSEGDQRMYQAVLGDSLDVIYRGEGCTYCAHSGYLGRTGVFEVMAVDDDIRSAIMEGGSTNEVKAAAIEAGMVTMQQDGISKIKAGITTPEEVIRKVSMLS